MWDLSSATGYTRSQTGPKYISKHSIKWGSKDSTEFLTSNWLKCSLIPKYISCEAPLHSTECSTSNDRSTCQTTKCNHERVQRLDGVLDLKWSKYSFILKSNYERDHCARRSARPQVIRVLINFFQKNDHKRPITLDGCPISSGQNMSQKVLYLFSKLHCHPRAGAFSQKLERDQ